MGRSILVAALAAGLGLVGLAAGATAQQTPQPFAPPVVGADPLLQAASPAGATYIPGVGFRYLAAGGPKVYGWTGYRTRVHGYRAYRRACRDRDWWSFDRCGHRRH